MVTVEAHASAIDQDNKSGPRAVVLVSSEQFQKCCSGTVSCAVCLRAWYAMSGIDVAYGSTRYNLTDRERREEFHARYLPTPILCDARY
eukprot:2667925-Rhodomonas_salina.3